MRKALLGVALAAVSLALTAPADGAVSVARVAFSGGGVAVSGGSYTLGATLGEAGVAGRVSGGSFTLAQGFWPNVLAITATDAPQIAEGAPTRVNHLGPNFPNPFVQSTAIGYSVARPSRVRLTVYNVAGRRVTALVDAPHAPGRYEAHWRGLDDSGTAVGTGVYLYRLDVGEWSETRKMLKIR